MALVLQTIGEIQKKNRSANRQLKFRFGSTATKRRGKVGAPAHSSVCEVHKQLVKLKEICAFRFVFSLFIRIFFFRSVCLVSSDVVVAAVEFLFAFATQKNRQTGFSVNSFCLLSILVALSLRFHRLRTTPARAHMANPSVRWTFHSFA